MENFKKDNIFNFNKDKDTAKAMEYKPINISKDSLKRGGTLDR